MRALIAGLLLTIAMASACAPAQPPAMAAAPAPLRVLFIGNSFTQGAHSAVRNWHADRVTDLMGVGYGGVPALLREFADQAKVPLTVSLETQGGKPLSFHLAERRAQIDQSWDVVVLQEHSLLDPKDPGNAAGYISATRDIAAMLRDRNPAVRIYLMATWTRPDQVHGTTGPWAGKPVEAMGIDLRRAADRVMREVPGLAGVIPVGEGFNRAFACNVADPNPYDGVSADRLDLWSYDHYHASVAGYYLEALIALGTITGVDPVSLGKDERAADQLGLSDRQATALQSVASAQLLGKPAGTC